VINILRFLFGKPPAAEPKPARVKVVSYGRSIEVGRFGKGRSGKTWFGWEVEVGEGETPELVLEALKRRADEQEIEEREAFAERSRDRKYD